MSAYAWIITGDHLAEANIGDPYTDLPSEVGTIGPRDATPEQVAALKAGAGRAFRMYDDDGEHYYTGRIVFAKALGDTSNEKLPEEGLGPLDDFGTPNAGCTEIRYFVHNKLTTL